VNYSSVDVMSTPGTQRYETSEGEAKDLEVI